MSLPMDFSTALWWRSVPVWEWEALPPPATDAAAPEGEGASAPHCAAPASAEATAPAPQPGDEREGYRRVFKGYQVSASLFWYPSDSPLSRPWLRHDEPAADRRPHAVGDEAAARAAQRQREPGTEPT